jgi:hypothetical protein
MNLKKNLTYYLAKDKMIKNKNIFLLSLSILSLLNVIVHASERQNDNLPNEKEHATFKVNKDMLREKKWAAFVAQENYYTNKTTRDEKQQKFNQDMNGLLGHFEKSIIDRSVNTVGNMLERRIETGVALLCDKLGYVTEADKKEKELIEETLKTKSVDRHYKKSAQITSDKNLYQELCRNNDSEECKEMKAKLKRTFLQHLKDQEEDQIKFSTKEGN